MSDTPKPDGGPAFPVVTGYSVDGTTIQQASGGMTLRDYFAAKAMVGLLGQQAYARSSDEDDSYELSRDAYAIADAMITERGV
jgi:hypothetical protein